MNKCINNVFKYNKDHILNKGKSKFKRDKIASKY